MTTSLVSMVRNETDIVETWARHVLKMFDHICIVDHCSSDGTYEYFHSLANHCKALRVLRYREKSYDQDTVFQHLRKIALDETDADWIFFLDADEFLPYQSAEEFNSAIDAVQSYDVLTFRWRNCLPASPGVDNLSFSGYRQIRPSLLGKVAIRRNIASNFSYRIPKGAHRLEHETMGTINGFDFGEIYHLPIRSIEQIWEKMLNGCISYLNVVSYDRRQGRHWFDILNHMLASGVTWSTAPELIYDYGERTKNLADRCTDGRLINREFEPCEFHFPGLDSPKMSLNKVLTTKARSTDGEVKEGNLHHVLRSKSLKKLLEEIMRLDKEGLVKFDSLATVVDDDEIRHFADFGSKKYATLSGDSSQTLTFDDLIDAMQAASWDIRHPVQSAWGEHVPFLFSLIALMKPRRFVELGVDRGASFLAACQAVQHLQLDCECVAVDSWVGDAHAGVHNSTVFHQFRDALAENYGTFAGYICANFDDAVGNFASGSIDLLHIDGFHTANAVRRDFENWVDKVSNRGIVLFHDTNEFKMDFGVWRFWRKIRNHYPYLEFGHEHGLGVLVVGEEGPLCKTIEQVPTSLLSSSVSDMLQVIFGSIGRLSWQFARQSVSEPRKELERTKKELESTRKALAPKDQRIQHLEELVRAYKESTSWRVTKPLRALRRILPRKLNQ
jgi:glycosyltransferase involved in cell wall biosynthesis